MSTVTLIILNRNGKHFLEPCLASIDRQTRPPDELILVDNGSDDGSQAWIRAHYPRATLLELGYNAGFSVAMNRAVDIVTGDYVTLLNNDTECEPQWLEVLTEALDQHPDVGFCSSKLLYFSERELIDTAGDLFTIGGFAFKRGWGHMDQDQYKKPERIFGACAGASIYRRSMFEGIEGFDEDFFAYQEDADLNFRAQLAGHPCLFVPEARVYHHVGGTWKKTGYEFAIRLGQRNVIFVLVKNLPAGLWLRFGIPIILAHGCLFLMRVWGGYGIPVIKGLWDAVTGLRPMLKKRKRIQQNRRVSNAYLASIMTYNWIHLLFEPFYRKRALKRQGIKV